MSNGCPRHEIHPVSGTKSLIDKKNQIEKQVFTLPSYQVFSRGNETIKMNVQSRSKSRKMPTETVTDRTEEVIFEKIMLEFT